MLIKSQIDEFCYKLNVLRLPATMSYTLPTEEPTYLCVGGGSNDSVLSGMVHNTGHFLGVSLQDGDNL